MKTIMAFYLNGCPYCANAKKAVEELTRENAAYQSIDLTWYEETEHADLLPAHPLYICTQYVR